jgi:flagellar basal body-associated protein FliL
MRRVRQRAEKIAGQNRPRKPSLNRVSREMRQLGKRLVSADSMSSLELSTPVRLRVRTPGKHIVLFVFGIASLVAAVVIIASRKPENAAAGVRSASTVAVAPVLGGAAIIELDEFLVDLSPDRTGRIAYLRLRAAVRAASGESAAAAEAIDVRRAELKERLSTLLRGLTADDFSGEEGLERVKREMLRRVQLVIGPIASEVIVTDIIVQ